MAQDITLLGASYSAVPAVVLPKTGGGSASFTDVTDTTAAAEDVASGKYFYTASGERTAGTATGGGGWTLDQFAERDFSGAITLPTATYIAPYSFYGSDITSISAPEVLNFKASSSDNNGSYVFAKCSLLRSVSFPKLENVGSTGYQFYQCTSLESVHFPNLVLPGSHFCDGCTALVTAVFENTSGNFSSYAFRDCTHLEAVDVGTLNRFDTAVFSNCSNLNVLVIRSASRVGMQNSNTLSGTPFASGGAGGTIYIPKSLYDHLGDGTGSDYKAATNWSTYNGYGTITWKKIEGSYYETHYADGTVIS